MYNTASPLCHCGLTEPLYDALTIDPSLSSIAWAVRSCPRAAGICAVRRLAIDRVIAD